MGPVSCRGRAVSSTAIRELLAGGDIREVNHLLGHPHRFTGRVAHGMQLGRKLGFPTVNLPWPRELQAPRYGVYAGRVLVDGRWLPALTNIGMKPTVCGDRCGLESHILDYGGDLYGRVLTVEFTDFLRPEKRFSSVEELREQVNRDIQGVRETLLR